MSPADVAQDFADDLARVIEVARLVVAGHVTNREAVWLLRDEHSRLRIRDGSTVEQLQQRLREVVGA